MKNKIRNWLYKVMYGRNGVDVLGRDLSYLVIFLIIVNLFLRSNARLIVTMIIWVLIVYTYFRMFSKNVYKRRSESNKYESKKKYIITRIKQAKQYRFFDCPNCKAHLRVPRGSGNITITCNKCGTKFDRKA